MAIRVEDIQPIPGVTRVYFFCTALPPEIEVPSFIDNRSTWRFDKDGVTLVIANVAAKWPDHESVIWGNQFEQFHASVEAWVAKAEGRQLSWTALASEGHTINPRGDFGAGKAFDFRAFKIANKATFAVGADVQVIMTPELATHEYESTGNNDETFLLFVPKQDEFDIWMHTFGGLARIAAYCADNITMIHLSLQADLDPDIDWKAFQETIEILVEKASEGVDLHDGKPYGLLHMGRSFLRQNVHTSVMKKFGIKLEFLEYHTTFDDGKTPFERTIDMVKERGVSMLPNITASVDQP